MNDEKGTRALVTSWRVGYPAQMFPRIPQIALLLCCATLLVQCNNAKTVVKVDNNDRQQSWHFARQTVPASAATVSGVYGNSSNELYVVGAGGVIMSYRSGTWASMSSPTAVNLTAIAGVENGANFKLPAGKGEMVAVGWHGTVLYFHPNPDGDPTTEDGAWSIIASSGDSTTGLLADPSAVQPTFSPLLKPDAACGDFDGDGRADDGDGDGWIGNYQNAQHICTGGQKTNCDDNCRTTANGDQRPLGDADGTGCVGPGSLPDLSRDQVDNDGDSIGLVCDTDDTVKQPPARFEGTLFSVWAKADGQNFEVVAVGEDGALVSFNGVSSSGTPSPTKQTVTDITGWIAQETLGYRFVDDCDDTTAPGQSCANGRLPPDCPAQCNPKKTVCTCPTDQGQCCDPSANTGDPPAANACGADGNCSTLCPTCFRRLEETLRSISVDGNNIAAVGASGTIVYGALDKLTDVWTAPSCPNPPPPLDQKPVLAVVQAEGGAFEIAGAAGAIFRGSSSGNCTIASRTGAPQGFLSGIYALGGDNSYVVGDEGTFLQVQGGTVTPIVTQITENLFGIAHTQAPLSDDELQSIGIDPKTIDPNTPPQQVDRYWLVGAGGTIVEASFF